MDMTLPAGLDAGDMAELCLRATAMHAESQARRPVLDACDAIGVVRIGDDESALIVLLNAVRQASRRLGYANAAIYRTEQRIGECIVDLAAAQAEREGGAL